MHSPAVELADDELQDAVGGVEIYKEPIPAFYSCYV